jgi:hypothetical protein
MMCGIFSRFKITGASKIMLSTIRKIVTGLVTSGVARTIKAEEDLRGGKEAAEERKGGAW